MLMFTQNARLKKRWVSALILAGLVSLQGCGGSRDEPFSPTLPDSGNEDTTKPAVRVDLEHFDNNPIRLSPEIGGKRLEIIKTEDEYFDILVDYMDLTGIAAPNFTNGQVLLYDAGTVNNNPCVHKLTFDTISAVQENDDVVKVIIKYTDIKPTTGASCNDNVENPGRPFHFFYVHSRDAVIIAEQVPRSSSSSSSSSSQRSSQSSSSSSSI